jgi:hypothetical protein
MCLKKIETQKKNNNIMETKDMKTASRKTVVAEKDGKKVEMTPAHLKALEKKGWKEAK